MSVLAACVILRQVADTGHFRFRVMLNHTVGVVFNVLECCTLAGVTVIVR